MRKLTLFSGVLLLTATPFALAQAQTLGLESKSNASADTNVSINAPVTGKTSVDAGVNADMTTYNDTYSGHKRAKTENSGEARGDARVKADTHAERKMNETIAKTEMKTRTEINNAESDFQEKRAKLEKDANAAVYDTGDRVQDLEGRTDVGVKATATTKIDVN